MFEYLVLGRGSIVDGKKETRKTASIKYLVNFSRHFLDGIAIRHLLGNEDKKQERTDLI